MLTFVLTLRIDLKASHEYLKIYFYIFINFRKENILWTQASAKGVSNNGVLFFGLVGDTSLACWNEKRLLDRENIVSHIFFSKIFPLKYKYTFLLMKNFFIYKLITLSFLCNKLIINLSLWLNQRWLREFLKPSGNFWLNDHVDRSKIN